MVTIFIFDGATLLTSHSNQIMSNNLQLFFDFAIFSFILPFLNLAFGFFFDTEGRTLIRHMEKWSQMS